MMLPLVFTRISQKNKGNHETSRSKFRYFISRTPTLFLRIRLSHGALMRCKNTLTIEGPAVDVSTIALGASPISPLRITPKTKSQIFASWGSAWDVKSNFLTVTDVGEDYAVLESKFSTKSAPPIEFYDYLSLSGMNVVATYFNPFMDIAGIYSNGDQLYLEDVTKATRSELEEIGIFDILIEDYQFNPERRMDFTENDNQNKTEFETKDGGKVRFVYGPDGLIYYDEVRHSVYVVVVEGGHGVPNWFGESVGEGFWVSVETGEYDMISEEESESLSSDAEVAEDEAVVDIVLGMSISEKDLPILQEELRKVLDGENFC